jgi:hypothetical protein
MKGRWQRQGPPTRPFGPKTLLAPATAPLRWGRAYSHPEAGERRCVEVRTAHPSLRITRASACIAARLYCSLVRDSRPSQSSSRALQIWNRGLSCALCARKRSAASAGFSVSAPRTRGEQCDAHPDGTSSIVSRFGCEPGNGCARSARTPEGPAGTRARRLCCIPSLAIYLECGAATRSTRCEHATGVDDRTRFTCKS